MKWQRLSARKRVVLSLVGLTVVSIGLFAVNVERTHSLAFDYLLWNLFLAWIPLVLAGLLIRCLRGRLWSNWLPVLLSVVWLVMLPNSFYMISDFIHVSEIAPGDQLYGIVMFTAFIITAACVGFASLYLIHSQLLKRLGMRLSSFWIAVVLLVCSFAIYLGRDLRWNSWDVLVNPAGILFDISDRIVHPLGHPGTISTTLSFFVLLGSLYVVGWQLGEATRESLPA